MQTLTVAGYQIHTLIYESASSQVYRAERMSDRAPVILKRLQLEYPTPGQRYRYQNEFRILSQLNDPGVVRVYDLIHQQATPILVLEDFGGCSLKSWLKQRLKQHKTLSWSEFWPIAIALAQSLDHIHQAGLIHKDINPANIVYNAQTQTLKLIDFGIASTNQSQFKIPDGVSSPPEFAGTLAYLAPEQTGRLGRPIDNRADLYGLGATFYELLTGTVLFQGEDVHTLFHHHLAYQPVWPDTWPSPFMALMDHLLAKDPEDRYQSARGLAADLAQCAQDWRSNGKLQPFTVGQQDVASRLRLSAKLYGRHEEQVILHEALERVTCSESRCEWVLISGPAGIGKSSVLAQFVPDISQRGYCLMVQVDALNRTTPYALAAAIVGQLIRRILQEPLMLIQQWQEALQQVLPPCSDYWCDRIPELQWLYSALELGRPLNRTLHKPLDATSGMGNRTQPFAAMFIQCLQMFAFPEHPLVLCLDDLTEADPESLSALVRLLNDVQTRSLLIVSTYRNSTLTQEHPLQRSIRAVEQEDDVFVRRVQLSGLGLEEILQLLKDTFHCDRAALTPLAFVTSRKTAGHPFFIREFLQNAHQAGHFQYCTDQNAWQWQIHAIEALTMTANVVDVLVQKLHQQPLQSQYVLRLAACLGTQFNLKTLMQLANINLIQGFQALIPWLKAEFIQPITEPNKQFVVANYRFVHERIRRAVYEAIALNRRHQVHRDIAHLFIRQASDPQYPEPLLTIVDHYNRGSIGVNASERLELIRLNLLASHQAQQSASDTAAYSYSLMAVSLIQHTDWQYYSELALTVLCHYAELAYQQGYLAGTAQLVQQAFTQNLDPLAVSTLSRLLLRQYALSGDVSALLELGTRTLTHWGLALDSTVPLPDANAQSAIEIQQVLSDLVALTWSCDRATWSQAIYLGAAWVEHCRPEITLPPWPYSALVEAPPTISTAMVGNQLTVVSQVRYQVMRLWMRAIWQQSWPEVATQMSMIATLGSDANLWLWHFYAVWGQLVLQFHCGRSLAELRAVNRILGEQAQTRNLNSLLPSSAAFEMLCQAWQEPETPPSWSLDITPGIGRATLQVMAVGTAWALELPWQVAPNALGCVAQTPAHAIALFQQAIAATQALLPGAPLPAVLLEAHNQCNQWQQQIPVPCGAWYELLQAEIARLDLRPWDALTSYDQAIAIAQAHQQWPTMGLAAECALKFWRSQPKLDFAKLYFRKAYYAYEQWGANAKLQHLEQSYPQCVTLPPLRTSLLSQTTHTSTSTDTQSGRVLDLGIVLKASQALAQELNLNQLLKKLLDILLVHMGAQRGLLLLEQDAELGIWAQGDVAHGTHILEFVRLSDAVVLQELPGTVVNYVMHTHEVVVINTVGVTHPYMNDPYFQVTNPKSVLCAPLLHQGQLTGVVYLENRLTAGSFTEGHLEVLNLLSGQAATAVVNARLYRQLETKVEQRTQALALKNLQLQEKIKEREETERALRLSEEKFGKLFHSSPNAIALTNLETGLHIEVNNTFCEVTGYRPDEIVGRTALDLGVWVKPHKRDRLFELLHSQGIVRNYEFEFRARSGKIHTALLSAEVITIHGQQCLLGTSTDITQRKTIEDKLRRQNLALMETLDQLQTTQQELIQSEKMAALGQLIAGVAHEINSPLGAITASTRHLINFWQRHFQGLLQQWQTFNPAQQILFFTLLDKTQQPYPPLSTREQRQLRRQFVKQLEDLALPNPRDVANYFIGLGIQELHPEHRALLQEARGESLLQLAYQLSNLHTSMITISTASERAGKVVFALKNYARFDPSDRQVQSQLVDGLETVLTLYHNKLKHNVEVVRQYEPQLPLLWCYPDELNQVWTNLIHNSLQAMENKGTLAIAVYHQGEHLFVSITDSGTGIPPEIQPQIFTPFFTTKPPGEGSGLGLDIVRRIVNKHQGEVNVESQPGATTFTVKLPIGEEADIETATDDPPAPQFASYNS